MIVVWVSVGLLFAGYLFSNSLFFLAAVLCATYLLLEGILFRRALDDFRRSAEIHNDPVYIQTIVGRAVPVETIITNNSRWSFQIVGLNRNMPLELEGELRASSGASLTSYATNRVITSLTATLAEKITVSGLNITLQGGTSLFR